MPDVYTDSMPMHQSAVSYKDIHSDLSATRMCHHAYHRIEITELSTKYICYVAVINKSR